MNADVTMPLSELDTLRKERQEAIDKVAFLEEKQMMVRVTVNERVRTYSTRVDPLSREASIEPGHEWHLYPHEYVSLDDVKAVIHREEMQRVAENINNMNEVIRDMNKKLQEKEDKLTKQANDFAVIVKEWEKAVENIKAGKEKEAEIDVMVENTNLKKKILSLEKMIRDIMEQGFWARIFKPIHVEL